MPTFSLVAVLSIIHVISLLISGISVLLLWHSFRINRNPLVKYFMWFFIFVFLWMVAYFTTLLLTTGSFIQSAGWELATSHGFFLIGLAFLARIGARIVWPQHEKLVFLASLFPALAITAFGIILRSNLIENTVPEANIFIIRISAVLTVAILVPTFLLFFSQTMKSNTPGEAIRSFLVSTGVALLVWHAISLVLIPIYGVLPWILGEALNVLAFALILAGILYRPPAEHA